MSVKSWVLPVSKCIPVSFTNQKQELKCDPRIINLYSIHFPSELGHFALYYHSSPEDIEEVKRMGEVIFIGDSTRFISNGEFYFNTKNKLITPNGAKLIQLSQLNSVMSSAPMLSTHCGLFAHRLKGKLWISIKPHSFINWSQQPQNLKNFQIMLTEFNLLSEEDGKLQWVFF